MATWKKVVVSGSAISQLNNDKNYLVNGTSSASLTGSFTGSFTGDGSGLTGVVASSAFNLTQGAGINTFTYNGTAAQTVSVDSSSLAGNGLTTSGGKFVVSASNGTINISANGISVSESQLQNIPNSALTNSGSIIGSTPVALGATVSSIAGLTLTGVVATGSFSGSFTGTTDLPDLTAGNGLSASIYDGSTARTFAVQASGSTLTVGSAGVAVNAAGITATELNSSVAGNGLSGGAGTALSVNVDDTSIEINTDALRVKAGGVSNAMLVNSGSIIGSTPVALGATVTSIAGLTLTSTVATGSFTGSFSGDGSGLTNITATSATSASFASTASYVNPLSQSVNISGSLNLALTGSSTLTIEGNQFQQTQLSSAGAIILNPGAGGVGMAGLNQSIEAPQFKGTGANSYMTGSFTGSFAGNGANVLGVVSASYALTASYALNANADLAFSGSTGTGTVDLASQVLSIIGTANEVETSAGGTTLTIGLPNDVTIGQDLIVSRNLTVLGTASFQNTTNLDVADRFILLASGSNTTGDGGIVVQQGTQGFGEAFAYDANTTRWAVTGSFDGSQATFVPEAFMAAVIEGAASDPTAVVGKLTKKGNIFVAADETIWIYS
jgi:hypothetical protein